MANGLHSAFRWSETENGTGDVASEIVNETEGELNATIEIVRDEGTSKELRGGLGGRQRKNFVERSLLEQVDGSERRATGRGNPGVAMPRGAVHPELAIELAKDDAVIAEKLYARLSHPETGRGAFTGTGMTEKEVAVGIAVGEPQSVKFHAFAAGEAVHHDKFIEGILEREDTRIRGIAGAIENNVSARERVIEPGGFIGLRAKSGARKIKFGTSAGAEGRPEAAGREGRRGGGSVDLMGPGDIHFDIAGMIWRRRKQKGAMLRVENDGHTAFAPQAEGKAAYLQGESSGAASKLSEVIEECGQWGFSGSCSKSGTQTAAGERKLPT
jgi:hypothetical protein